MDIELVLELPSKLSSIGDAVDDVIRKCSFRHSQARRLNLNFRVGLTEALSNAVLYGNCEDPSKPVRLEVMMNETSVVACITDQGEGFNPESVPDPTLPPNIMRSRGRGVFLMRKLLDEVRFNDRGNSVTLVLHLSPVAMDSRAPATTGLGGEAST